jgi:hypothetical protein
VQQCVLRLIRFKRTQGAGGNACFVCACIHQVSLEFAAFVRMMSLAFAARRVASGGPMSFYAKHVATGPARLRQFLATWT